MNNANILFAFFCLLRKELLLSYRHRADLIYPLIFFILIAMLFSLGLKLDATLLQAAGPGVIWLSALLAHILALDRLFHQDFADGSLEQLLLTPYTLTVLVYAKLLAHWLITTLPLIIIAPLLSLFLQLSTIEMFVLIASLIIATPILTVIGGIGAALTVGLRGRILLLPLLLLPLYIPVLIFGAGSVYALATTVSVSGLLALLGGFSIFSLLLSPFAIAAALRVGINEL